MTRHDAKEKALEWWGERGMLARVLVIFGLIGSTWVGLTAAKNTAKYAVELWLVPQEQFEARDDSLDSFFVRQQIADIQWKAEDAAFKREIRQKLYEDCVRHHGQRSCIPPR